MRRLAAVALVALAACSKPLPLDKTAYAGEWTSATMLLRISEDGKVEYKRNRDGVTKSIEAPIVEFQGDNFVVGFLSWKTTFVVSTPPHREGDVWRMTVDSVVLTRPPH